MIFATGNYSKFQMIKMTSIVPLILRPHKTESPWINVSIIINVSSCNKWVEADHCPNLHPPPSPPNYTTFLCAPLCLGVSPGGNTRFT